jgi:hypothetical protein
VTEPVFDSPTQPDSRDGVSPATILFGLVLLMLGMLWLLDVAGMFDITWTLVGSFILILIGVLLIAAARHGSHGGMIFLGIVLSVVVLLGSLASWPSFEGGVGDRAISPGSITDLASEYNWGVGSQEIDLRAIDFPEGETLIAVQMGVGDLQIHLPPDLAYHIEWSVGLGDAQILDRNQSGISLDGTYESEGYEDAERQLSIEVQLGMGALEVRE